MVENRDLDLLAGFPPDQWEEVLQDERDGLSLFELEMERLDYYEEE